MCEYYQHYLIPIPCDYSPVAYSLLRFIGELRQAGYVSETHSIVFSLVEKHENSTRVGTNPFTGEKSVLKMPSRSAGKVQSIEDLDQLAGLIHSVEEYDITVSGDRVPANPPLEIGFVEGSMWKPVKEPYYNEIKLRVRSHIVRISHLRSEDDLHRPPDFTNPPAPIFDEDCDSNEADGLFLDPRALTMRIVGAGCGMFWIEFNFGKFVYPKAVASGVDFLDDSLVALAEKVFEVDFVQACHMG